MLDRHERHARVKILPRSYPHRRLAIKRYFAFPCRNRFSHQYIFMFGTPSGMRILIFDNSFFVILFGTIKIIFFLNSLICAVNFTSRHNGYLSLSGDLLGVVDKVSISSTVPDSVNISWIQIIDSGQCVSFLLVLVQYELT